MPLLLLVAVLAVVTVLVASLVSSGRTPEAAPPEETAVSAAATPTPAPSSSSPLPSGSDAGEGLEVPEGSQQAATAFVRAWLERDRTTREPALAQVSSPALAEGLMLTDPANIPRARPRGAPVLEDASTYSAQFTQALSVGPAIKIYLVADPEARYGWLAASVEQA